MTTIDGCASPVEEMVGIEWVNNQSWRKCQKLYTQDTENNDYLLSSNQFAGNQEWYQQSRGLEKSNEQKQIYLKKNNITKPRGKCIGVGIGFLERRVLNPVPNIDPGLSGIGRSENLSIWPDRDKEMLQRGISIGAPCLPPRKENQIEWSSRIVGKTRRFTIYKGRLAY